MISGRGTHHVDEAPASPDVDSVEQSSDDDEKTPLLWWVKTIASWTLLGAAVALLAALVVVPRLTGSTAYTVLTGSMEPTYPPGTLIVVKPTPGDQLKAGDVITFQPKSGDPSVTTHRIVSIVYDASGVRKFITKGDANNTTDEPIIADQVRGRLIYSVPKLGYLNNVMSGNTRGIAMFLIAGGLGLYALWMWISSIRDRKKPKDDDPTPHPESPSSNEWPAYEVPGSSSKVFPGSSSEVEKHSEPKQYTPAEWHPIVPSTPSAVEEHPFVVEQAPTDAYSPLAELFPAQTTAVAESPPSSCHACGAPAPPPVHPLADVPSTATTRPIPIIK